MKAINKAWFANEDRPTITYLGNSTIALQDSFQVAYNHEAEIPRTTDGDSMI